MKPIECNTCGETCYLLERGEKQVRETSKETPLDHMRRAGHDPREPPEIVPERRQCNSCGNVWWYTGDADRPTCPHCRGKDTEPAALEAE